MLTNVNKPITNMDNVLQEKFDFNFYLQKIILCLDINNMTMQSAEKVNPNSNSVHDPHHFIFVPIINDPLSPTMNIDEEKLLCMANNFEISLFSNNHVFGGNKYYEYSVGLTHYELIITCPNNNPNFSFNFIKNKIKELQSRGIIADVKIETNENRELNTEQLENKDKNLLTLQSPVLEESDDSFEIKELTEEEFNQQKQLEQQEKLKTKKSIENKNIIFDTAYPEKLFDSSEKKERKNKNNNLRKKTITPEETYGKETIHKKKRKKV